MMTIRRAGGLYGNIKGEGVLYNAPFVYLNIVVDRFLLIFIVLILALVPFSLFA